MEFSVWTNNKPVVLSFDAETKENIVVIGYDPTHEKTVFFCRQILENGNYQFNMPLSPKLLKVLIFNEKESNVSGSVTDIRSLSVAEVSRSQTFIISNVKLNNLAKSSLIIDANTKEFIDFAQQFSLKAGYSKPGNYYSKNNKFQIQYMQKIDEADKTPSRIHKITGIIDISKNWFNETPIPQRVALCLHEYAHNHLDSEDKFLNIDLLSQAQYKAYIDKIEKEADANALQIYLALGYPKIEWIYTWTDIFTDTDSHYDRLVSSDINIGGM